MTDNTSFPNNEKFYDTKKYKYSGSGCDNPEKTFQRDIDISKIEANKKSSSNFEVKIDKEEMDIENEPLIQILMESSPRVQIVKDFQKDSESYEDLGPE